MLSTDICRCDGGQCPSRMNCRRYTERHVKGEHITQAALWARREAGSSACDMWIPVRIVTTFKDKP